MLLCFKHQEVLFCSRTGLWDPTCSTLRRTGPPPDPDAVRLRLMTHPASFRAIYTRPFSVSSWIRTSSSILTPVGHVGAEEECSWAERTRTAEPGPNVRPPRLWVAAKWRRQNRRPASRTWNGSAGGAADVPSWRISADQGEWRWVAAKLIILMSSDSQNPSSVFWPEAGPVVTAASELQPEW